MIVRLNAEVNRVLVLADVRRHLDQLGLEIAGGAPEKFAAFIRSEADCLKRFIIKAGALQAE